MAQFVNQNSFLLVVLPLVVLLLYFLLRPPGSLLKQILAMLLLLAVVSGFLFARPGKHAASKEGVESLLLEGGRPTLLEIYSPY